MTCDLPSQVNSLAITTATFVVVNFLSGWWVFQTLVPNLEKFGRKLFFFPYTVGRHGDKFEEPCIEFFFLSSYLYFMPWKYTPARRDVTQKSTICRHATLPSDLSKFVCFLDCEYCVTRRHFLCPLRIMV